MERALVVKGRLIGPKNVELDEPLSQTSGEVEVVIRLPAEGTTVDGDDIFDIVADLAPGTRTKEDIDRQIRANRESWGDR
ncbi:MAG: hypothetical protein HY815_26380 [Candidatus Riflebacteria bacterium]|nr:hypothetical protein [Candidatus Riflebacteria bacterium]